MELNETNLAAGSLVLALPEAQACAWLLLWTASGHLASQPWPICHESPTPESTVPQQDSKYLCDSVEVAPRNGKSLQHSLEGEHAHT